jgi:alpha-mannosidase
MLIPKIEKRIDQYLNFLEEQAYREVGALEFEVLETDKTYRSPPEEKDWRKITAPAPWGKAWHTAWFRSIYRAPKTDRPLFLRVIPNADSLAFIDGKPAGAFNLYHKKLRISADGAEHCLHLEAYAGHLHTGCGPFEGASIVVNIGKTLRDFPNTFEGGSLLERREKIYSLYYDVKALLDLARELDANSLRRARVLRGLFDALGRIHFSDGGETLEAACAEAADMIRPLLEAKNGPTVPEVYLIGHAHMDHAWLWPIAETERKIGRTFMNMIQFIKEYPEFVFIQSQPCQLEILKNEYPDVFMAVKAACQTGAWEPNGGMWVEADCNIPSGESLIRQFLVGKAANRELLGEAAAEADTLWLPDAFGYTAALPQILTGCRITYFVTSKLSWNDTTRFPYDTFVWRGIDGTGIKAHFIIGREEGYNGHVGAHSLTAAWNEVQHKEIQRGIIRAIGEGDGGGGTLRADLEMARRFIDLEGAPRTAWIKASEALNRIFAEADALPEWQGELYMEGHRGTYTTQAKTKASNRRLEFGLRGAEFLAAWADIEGFAPYPWDRLLAAWKKLLTNQFHDIIPGSSIGRVYADAEKAYQSVREDVDDISLPILRHIMSRAGGDLIVFNDLSWNRSDPLHIPAAALGRVAALESAGKSSEGPFPVQYYTGPDGQETAVCAPHLPPLGWAAFTVLSEYAAPSPFNYREGARPRLETPFYQVVFDSAGGIISLIGKDRNCELVAPGGCFNRFISAEDVPVFWEAWDIDADWTRFLTEELNLCSTEIAADGPVCFRLRRIYRIGASSRLTQDMVFYAFNPRIDFETLVDWQEKRRLLKVGFNTTIAASQIRCEIQYGHLFRNTHRNLPQDRAMFEICAHKWVCLEEAGGGIALLNDSKYGHDAEGGNLRLTLLRSPLAPDAEADRGKHYFTYSLLPFAGPFCQSRIVQAAYELNAPARVERNPVVSPPSGDISGFSLFTIDGSQVIAECVKKPEPGKSGPKSLIIRLYECLGGACTTTLRFSRPLSAAQERDMLEDNPRDLPAGEKELPLDFRAFEIKTILVRFC